MAELTVRYHLKMMDTRGLTRLEGNRDGRVVTALGIEELGNALVGDKMGRVISKIELLTYETTFDLKTGRGRIPINTTIIDHKALPQALSMMADAFKAGLCMSDLIAVSQAGEQLGELVVPEGKVGLATVCSIAVNGCLLKAGVPMHSRFGGLIEIHNGKPRRFVELVEYAGTSLDPSQIFITGRLTTVNAATRGGNGRVLANFREVPVACVDQTTRVLERLKEWRVHGLLEMGRMNDPVRQIDVASDRVGSVLLGGLNPVAAVIESEVQGIESHSMSGVVEYSSLRSFWDVLAPVNGHLKT
jgi:repressor of nif and glnA expression